MFYIIETKYVGPNHDQNVDADTVEITTVPAETNSSHEVRTEGWCGTTNDWSVYAHGEYETLEAAKKAVKEIFGEVRDCDSERHDFGGYDTAAVEVYKPGKFSPMSRQETADWAHDGMRSDITADTTDEQIAELVAEYEGYANSDGCTLDGDLEDMMIRYRDDKRAEREEDQDDE